MDINTTQIISKPKTQIYRLSIAPNKHFEFNHFLCIGTKTCLVHAGKKSYFPQLKHEVSQLLQGKNLDVIVFSHFEADECGSINHWLDCYQECNVVCNKTANISLGDMVKRPAQIIKDGETIDLGEIQLEMIETPHFPHNWDAHLWFEQSCGVLFSSDFCIDGGICSPLTNKDISKDIIAYYEAGNFIPYGQTTNTALNKISKLPINIIAPMHGSTLIGENVPNILRSVTEDLRSKSEARELPHHLQIP